MTTFQNDFARFACIGDSIVARVILAGKDTGLRLEATLYADDDYTPPDERDEGYWPSLNPDSAGYIGPKSKATLQRHTKRARDVLEAWRNDEWHYVGVAVRAWFDDTPLTGEYDFAVWGVEMNYPTKGKRNPNAYLREVANESAYDCAAAAIARITEMLESVA